MADPLKLLREYALDNKPIKIKDDYIVFNDIAFPKDVKTNFKIFARTNEWYSLESLYFFYQRREMAHTAYVKDAAGKQLQPVTRPDRKDLIDYLTNRNSKVPASIDVTAPVPVPVQLARHSAHSGHDVSALTDDSQPAEKRSRLEDLDSAKKEKERIDRLLDAPLRPTTEQEQLRDLSESLTKDKLKNIKSKFQARKRTQIKATEDDLFAVGAEGLGGAVDLAALDRDLKGRERLWRTRTACMEAPTKNFSKNVFAILQFLKSKEDGASAGAAAIASQENHSKQHSAVDPANKPRTVQQAGYSRYEQEIFKKQETGDLKINTAGTYHGITLKSITEGAKPKAQTPDPHKAAGKGSQENEPQKPHKRVSRTPIIIIPAASTSLINMYNAGPLLESHRYISADEQKANGFRRDNEMLIHRPKEGGVSVPYRVVDNPLKLTAEEWDRVVAVFVQGPAWQFKGWPWGGTPVDIFARIAAFHLKWDELKLDANVAKWNVRVLTLSKTKRHLDRASLLRFWEILDKHIIKTKPYLRS